MKQNPQKIINQVQIFLCHSSKDEEDVAQIADQLKSEHIVVWYFEWIIEYGDSITQKINEGISGSDYLAIVLSPDAVKSEWVKSEWSSAYYNEKKWGSIKVLPILLKDCDIPTLLSEKKYADFRGSKRSQELEKLKRWLENKATGLPVNINKGAIEKGVNESDKQMNDESVTSDSETTPTLLSTEICFHLVDRPSQTYGSIAQAATGVIVANLLDIYPSALIDERTSKLSFPFGELKTYTQAENAKCTLKILNGSAVSLWNLFTEEQMPGLQGIEWIEFIFSNEFSVDDVHSNLRYKNIKVTRASVKHKELSIEIGAGIITCSSVGNQQTKIRYEVHRWEYSATKIYAFFPLDHEVWGLFFGSLKESEFRDKWHNL